MADGERIRQLDNALAEQGLGLRPQHLREGPWSIAFGRENLRAILNASAPQPTAIICGNDYLAIGAVLEARAMGLAVPADLSITGFDDVAMSTQTEPPLTTMRVDNAEIGHLAARDLLARLSGTTPPPVPALIPAFVERSSTAAPRRYDLAPVGRAPRISS